MSQYYKSIYEKNTRIITDEDPSAFFPCNIGVRQDDNLSPLLFTLFLNDLEHYPDQHTPGINVDYIDGDTCISVLLKLIILLYADDTVIFGEVSGWVGRWFWVASSARASYYFGIW